MAFRKEVIVWAAAGGGALLVLFLLYYLQLPEDRAYSICASRRFLGLYCPGCGLTRALSLLLKGQVEASFQLHPLAAVFLLEGVVIWAGWGLTLMGTVRSPSARKVNLWLYVQLLLLVSVWLIRLATGTLPG